MISNIHILHVTERHSKESGGLTTVVNNLSENMTKRGLHSTIVAATDNSEYVPEEVDFIGLGEGCNKAAAFFSTNLLSNIRQVIEEKRITVIHIHGFWMPLQLVAAQVAIDMKIPFMISTHGMLEPWLWGYKGRFSHLKKKLYFKFFAYHVYKKASLIHAITPNECNSLKQLFPENSTVTIPNAIEGDLVEYNESNVHDKSIFFIGRISPVKGVDLLLRAYKKSDLSTSGWSVIVAGPEESSDYAESLRELVKRNGLGAYVQFIGPVYEKEKELLFRCSWVTVVPSFSEVVGMVNLEASLYSCPTITTHQCGLWDWEDGGGMLIDPEVKALSDALKLCSMWSEVERRTRGRSSFDLVQNKYSWTVVAKQWLSTALSEVFCTTQAVALTIDMHI